MTQISHVLKPGKEATQYASYRQITLTGIIRKVLEKMLMTRVIRYVITCDLINERSMAGLRGKAAIDALTLFTNDVLSLCTCSPCSVIPQCSSIHREK